MSPKLTVWLNSPGSTCAMPSAYRASKPMSLYTSLAARRALSAAASPAARSRCWFLSRFSIGTYLPP